MGRVGMVAVVCALAAAMPARAQVNPELGDVGEPPDDALEPPPDEGIGGEAGFGASGGAGMGYQPTPAPAPAPAPAATGTWTPPTGQVPSRMPPRPSDDGDTTGDGRSDHAAMVEHLGVGFFGTVTVPVMGCPNAPAGCTVDGSAGSPFSADVGAPTIGVRYWIDAGLGIEAALGFNHTSGEFQSDFEMGTSTTRVLLPPAQPSVTAFALHGAVPIALAHSGHFVFEVVPHLNFGLSTGTYEGAMASQSWDISGFLVDVGGKVGAEIHFGFIDIPQLSLQGNVGLSLRLESRSAEQPGPPKITHEQSITRLSTGVGGEPWDIFTGSIAAIYYL